MSDIDCLNRPSRTEAQARADLAARNSNDPFWRERWDRQVNNGHKPDEEARRFAHLTHHLRLNGKPLVSTLLKLRAEKKGAHS